MNYELKSISPGSVLWNALRIFLLVGFVVAIISFFIVNNPAIHITSVLQKIAAVLLFTAVYGVVVSVILTFIALLYNFWAAKFKGVTIHLEQE